MKRGQNIFMMVVFLVMLILPLLFADWRGGGLSYEENRILAKAPWRMEKNPDFRRSLESWINDNAGFRSQAMQGKIITEYHLFNHSAVPDTLIGQDNWIYYATKDILKDYTGENLWTDFELDMQSIRLNNLNALVEQNGAKLLMTILPDKKTVYPEHYFPHIRHETENNRTKQLVESIRSHIPAPLILMEDFLLPKKSVGVLYCPRTDTGHWNNLGAYVGYEALMQAAENLLGQTIPYVPLSECRVTEIEEKGIFYNTLEMTETGYYIENSRTDNQRLNPDYMEKFPFLTYADRPEAFKVYYENLRGETLPRILYIADSYCERLHPYLAQSAASMMVLHISDARSLPKILETEKFDLVIFEMVERMVDSFNMQLDLLFHDMHDPV